MQIGPGSVVGGKYRIEQALARGGMGSVWVARHAQLGSTVAVKFLDASFAASAAHRARFEREARAAANLKSPHVVHVSDYGFEGDAPYLIMELLEGEDLGKRLHRVGRMSPHDTAAVLKQIAKALRKAHEAGFAHRDLKPANLFVARVDDEEVVKVLDFGIAKESKAPLSEATRTGEVMGSPHYMSPEQIRAEKDVDHRTDLWSLGVILYRMLTGALPFTGDQLGPVLAKILTDPAPPPSQVAPDLSASIDAFFARAFMRDKKQRFQSVGEMFEAFQLAIGRDVSPSLPEIGAPVAGSPAAPLIARPSSPGPAPVVQEATTTPAVGRRSGYDAPGAHTPPDMAPVLPMQNVATIPLGPSDAPAASASQSGGHSALSPSEPITGSGPQRISMSHSGLSTTTVTKPKTSGVVIAIAVVAVLGLGGALGAFLFLRGPSPSDAPSAANATSTPALGTSSALTAPSPSTTGASPAVTPSAPASAEPTASASVTAAPSSAPATSASATAAPSGASSATAPKPTSVKPAPTGEKWF